jgi:hypothetical protein
MIKLVALLFEETDTTHSFANRVSEELKRYKTFKDLSEFTEKLRPLDQGGYRFVYYLGNGLVLKVVNDETVTVENKWEIEAKKCLDDTYTTKIYGYDDVNYWWLIAEEIESGNEKKTKDAILRVLEGSSFLSIKIGDPRVHIKEPKDLPVSLFFRVFADYLINGIESRLSFKDHRNPWLSGLIEQLRRCKVSPNDLRADNWGTRDGMPVILDYGLEGD